MSTEDEILAVLKKHYPQDLSIKEIAELSGYSRETVSKYLYGLEKGGKIKLNRVLGHTKLFVIVGKE
jgi:predicted transcriptional regulator